MLTPKSSWLEPCRCPGGKDWRGWQIEGDDEAGNLLWGTGREVGHRGNSSLTAQSGRWGTGGDGSNELSMRPTVESESTGEPAQSSRRLKGTELLP
jgi:hypothetical protein